MPTAFAEPLGSLRRMLSYKGLIFIYSDECQGKVPILWKSWGCPLNPVPSLSAHAELMAILHG